MWPVNYMLSNEGYFAMSQRKKQNHMHLTLTRKMHTTIRLTTSIQVIVMHQMNICQPVALQVRLSGSMTYPARQKHLKLPFVFKHNWLHIPGILHSSISISTTFRKYYHRTTLKYSPQFDSRLLGLIKVVRDK